MIDLKIMLFDRKISTINNCPNMITILFLLLDSADCSLYNSHLDRCMSGDQVAFRFHPCSQSEDSKDTYLSTLMMQNVEKSSEFYPFKANKKTKSHTIRVNFLWSKGSDESRESVEIQLQAIGSGK